MGRRDFSEKAGIVLCVALLFFIILALVRSNVEEFYQQTAAPLTPPPRSDPALKELREIRRKLDLLERRLNGRASGKQRGKKQG